MVNVRMVHGLTLVALGLTLATTTQALTVDTRAQEENDVQRKLLLDGSLGVGLGLGLSTNTATNAATPETDAPSTPETDAPSTPETDAPSTPETDAPSTPETDAPCTYSYGSAIDTDDYRRSIHTDYRCSIHAGNGCPEFDSFSGHKPVDACAYDGSIHTDYRCSIHAGNGCPEFDSFSGHKPVDACAYDGSIHTDYRCSIHAGNGCPEFDSFSGHKPVDACAYDGSIHTDYRCSIHAGNGCPEFDSFSGYKPVDACAYDGSVFGHDDPFHGDRDTCSHISLNSCDRLADNSPNGYNDTVDYDESCGYDYAGDDFTGYPNVDPGCYNGTVDYDESCGYDYANDDFTGYPNVDPGCYNCTVDYGLTVPSTDTPATATPSTKTPSTETPATDKPSPTEEPPASSGSSDTYTESPPPVTKTPDDDATLAPTPVTTMPRATKSPIAIETNSGSEDEQDASEQKDQTQSDVVMYNASATPITAKSGSSDPFAIPEDTSATVKPVVLDISDNGNSVSQETETYVRGKTATSGSAATTNANVIGGRNTYVDTENSDVLSSSAAAFHDFLRYASVAFAGISVALLLFFHFVSLDANLLWVNTAWSPNTWEFMFYVGYLQQMQATSELTVLKTPYFLWDYTDSFAWSNFLAQDSSASSGESRRLETIVLGGIVSYADRIGISEEKILTDSAIGFTVIMGILLAIFLVLAMMAKRKAEKALDESSDLNSYTSGVHRLRSVSIRTLGLCVLVWYFSLFPLSMLASFEISMEVQASTIADSLVVAIIALVLVCFGVLAVAGRVIMHKTKDELEQFENLATWGSLYCEYTYRSRMFFVIDVVVQITTGILVGTVSGDPTQLIVVLGIQVLYLACVFIMSPFADQMVLRITYVLGLLKIVNFSLAFAFLNSNTMSATARTRLAQAFIGINAIVILAWFVRQLVVFSTYIRAWMVRSNDDSRDSSNPVAKFSRQSDTESEMYASQYTARGGLADTRGLNDSVNGGTLSLPKGSSVQSMQPSYGQGSSAQSMTTSYGQTSSFQSMEPSFGSELQYQQQMDRKYEIGF
ncbi:hypothetical protein BBI17_006825 [Phytophthora kernoviae]|uniref:TRP C-terminal domain-containing protein n=1 Tax=Phytophthora kernoviae TaxID=325452 RepID=A0A421FEN6_9STRA|nr:hypothetical protein JM16_001861 [Phytophthora kernoviae]RLN43661.1 hypothetical protein BBI17_006825 [Phytophthora kernoviae]